MKHNVKVKFDHKAQCNLEMSYNHRVRKKKLVKTKDSTPAASRERYKNNIYNTKIF